MDSPDSRFYKVLSKRFDFLDSSILLQPVCPARRSPRLFNFTPAWMAGEGELEDQLRLRHPFLIIGIGGAGNKLAREAARVVGCNYVQISSEEQDFDGSGHSIRVQTGDLVYPSSRSLTWFANSCKQELAEQMAHSKTIFVISNLAGRNGIGMAPMVCSLAKESGATVISVVIMPFGFEKNKIFDSGIALRRVRQQSDSTIIADNDAFIEVNPEMSPAECISSVNKAIIHVFSSLNSHSLAPEVNLVCAGGHSDVESCLQDSVSMAYRNSPEPLAIKRAVIYVENPAISVGELSRLAGYAEGMFSELGKTQVEVARSYAGDSQVHLLASGIVRTRFDRYDPLAGLASVEANSDLNEPECALAVDLPVFNVE